MRQALEMALEWIKKQPEETPESKYDVDTRYVVLRELEAALAQEQEPVPAAMKTVIEAMQQDPDYAWGWHCNIAMSFVDAGGDHYTGNKGAARFMRTLANVEPAHELPSPLPQRTWVGLTNDEINNLAAGCHLGNSVQDAIYKAVAKLKEKNF